MGRLQPDFLDRRDAHTPDRRRRRLAQREPVSQTGGRPTRWIRITVGANLYEADEALSRKDFCKHVASRHQGTQRNPLLAPIPDQTRGNPIRSARAPPGRGRRNQTRSRHDSAQKLAERRVTPSISFQEHSSDLAICQFAVSGDFWSPMPVEITMPRLSDTMEQGTIVSWNVKEGDEVSAGDVLADIETDKATMELENFDDGTVAKILAGEGDDRLGGRLDRGPRRGGRGPRRGRQAAAESRRRRGRRRESEEEHAVGGGDSSRKRLKEQSRAGRDREAKSGRHRW